MKLVSFNYTNSRKSGKCSADTIRILNNGGLITFNGNIVSRCGLKVGDKIEFFKNEDASSGIDPTRPPAPGDWYFAKSEKGFSLHSDTNNKELSVALNTVVVARSILGTMKAASYHIGETPLKFEGKELWLIFTNNPLNVRE